MPSDSELQDLTADIEPAAGDVVYVVIDPAGTPLARKMTVENLLKAVHLLSELTTSTTDTDKLLIGNSLEGTWAKYITPENLFKSIIAGTADTAPTTDDAMLTVNDPAGMAAARYATIANLMKAWFLDSERNLDLCLGKHIHRLGRCHGAVPQGHETQADADDRQVFLCHRLVLRSEYDSDSNGGHGLHFSECRNHIAILFISGISAGLPGLVRLYTNLLGVRFNDLDHSHDILLRVLYDWRRCGFQSTRARNRWWNAELCAASHRARDSSECQRPRRRGPHHRERCRKGGSYIWSNDDPRRRAHSIRWKLGSSGQHGLPNGDSISSGVRLHAPQRPRHPEAALRGPHQAGRGPGEICRRLGQ